MKVTTETKEITITTRVYTLVVTEEELRALEMGMDRLSSSYVARKNPHIAAVADGITKALNAVVDNMEVTREAREQEEEEEEDDDY